MKTTRHGDCRRRFTRIFANEPAAQPKLLGDVSGALRHTRRLRRRESRRDRGTPAHSRTVRGARVATLRRSTAAVRRGTRRADYPAPAAATLSRDDGDTTPQRRTGRSLGGEASAQIAGRHFIETLPCAYMRCGCSTAQHRSSSDSALIDIQETS